jgi:hypothetical protein
MATTIILAKMRFKKYLREKSSEHFFDHVGSIWHDSMLGLAKSFEYTLSATVANTVNDKHNNNHFGQLSTQRERSAKQSHFLLRKTR